MNKSYFIQFSILTLLAVLFLAATAWAKSPPKAINACSGLSKTQACSFTTPKGNLFSGSCAMVDGVLACQASTQPPKTVDSTQPPNIKACSNLSEGTACSYETSDGSNSGTCTSGDSGGMFCQTETAATIKACSSFNKGTVCNYETSDGSKSGICVSGDSSGMFCQTETAAAIKACSSQSEGAVCSFNTSDGSKSGACASGDDGGVFCQTETDFTPQIIACGDLRKGNACIFEGKDGIAKNGFCTIGSNGLLCLIDGAPLPSPPEGAIPPPEDKDGTLSPPSSPLGSNLPPPPKKKAKRTPPQPPQRTIDSCIGLGEKEACRFISVFGNPINGICTDIHGTFACLPSNPPPPPPLRGLMPGGFTNGDGLRRNSALFRTRWQAHRANVQSFIKRNTGVPEDVSLPEGGEAGIERIEDEIPVYFGTDTPSSSGGSVTPSYQSMNTSMLWDAGVTGNGYTGLGVWDAGGVLTTHSEFGTRVVQGDTPANNSDHSTHVAGTITATGSDATAQGMAYQAGISAYDWDNDDSEMAAAAANGMEVSNHSYGVISGWVNMGMEDTSSKWCWYGNGNISAQEDYKFGYYNTDAEGFDQIAYDAAYYLIVKAAGNDRDNNPVAGDLVDIDHDFTCDNFSTAYDSSAHPGGDGTNDSGYDSIMPGSTAKNILTVGAVDADRKMSSFSGWGPTDDGRIKPDIMGHGVDVYSTSSSGAYTVKNGTSMASPAVTGSLALLQQYWRNLTGQAMLAATLKALTIHTADDLGNIGPDYQYGWGHLNNTAALVLLQAENASAVGLHLLELSLAQNGVEDIFLNIPAGTIELRATLVWNDSPSSVPSPALDPTDSTLIDDLDLRIVRLSDNAEFQP